MGCGGFFTLYNVVHQPHEFFLLSHELWALVAGFVEELLEVVYRAQGNVEYCAVHLAFVAAYQVVDRLHVVGETVYLLVAEHAAIPLEGVHDAEYALHDIDIARIFLEFENRFLERVDEVHRLLYKLLLEVVH